MATANFRVATEEKQNIQNEILLRIANKMGAFEEPMSWAAIQTQVRAGTIGLSVQPGDQLDVDTADVLSAAAHGEGITAVTVTDKDLFLSAAGTHVHDYEFSYDGSAWHYKGNPVLLSDFGLSVTGTAASGDAITVHRTTTTYAFNVMGLDEDQPVDSARKHVLPIQMHKVYTYGSIPFDPAMYLFAVTAAACTAFGWDAAVGMPAGTYNVTLNHAAYNGGTTQDGTFQFTTTQPIPVGGGIRHSAIGVYQSESYTKDQILAGTFTTYADDTVTTVESSLTTTEGNDGTNLGTTTACDPQYKVGDFINFTHRQAYGCGRWSKCFMRQYANSAEATMTFAPATIWSRRPATLPEGFLHSIDPELRAVLGKVRTRYALSIADGYGYEDVEDYVKLATMLDVLGSKNNSISEGPVDSSGNVTRTTAYSFWQAHNSNADRKKYQGTTANGWWLGSSNPPYAHNERYVLTDGSLYSNFANYTFGFVPSLFII